MTLAINLPKALSNEAMILRLPGRDIDVSNIVNVKKKFRGSRGGIEGALSAMRSLQADGLGELLVKNKKRSVEVNC